MCFTHLSLHFLHILVRSNSRFVGPEGWDGKGSKHKVWPQVVGRQGVWVQCLECHEKWEVEVCLG